MHIETPSGEHLVASISTTLEVLAGEIELASARCIFLDSTIGEIMPSVRPEQRDRLLASLQAVDLLSQHLTGLSAFARTMSMAVPDEIAAPVGEALSVITLGALSDRMQSALGGVEKGINDGDDAGDLDLF